ncbi:lauroyl-Kdo(2)-lipid IV(A) myristoyltransferase [Enterovibrio nigricans]|uniref:Lipid A biosynthesis acyltransferase n=1 Tax=Enterovibrio nigricans DSM 22720 TaxID=1121868 RepID=A0A1T4UH96_9GAMM|nr:lauroyl-Kdo(2)-lipid IV(A) myristoyltransferase [Enterovibrio nigricans]PKF51307.1 lauroyl-Kdo(2)-lipid IV(A) myristoyltransferase [Enterovibrio nigricans]SKA52037.1 lauroyl-KDO2-lipid IV(A) myristoyltransferase [Enterovibrio nigricans DSM 22720]
MSQDSNTNSSYLPTFESAFLHPRYWRTWLGIFFAAILAFVPFRLRDKLATFLAKRLVKLNNRAKKRAVINIQECFPEKTDEERYAILEQSYINAGCVMLGFATIMMRSKKYLESRTLFRNEDILTELVEDGENVILLVPHSWPIDYPAVQLASRGLPVAAMVKKQKNKVIDWLMNVQRLKYGGRIHERSDGVKPFIKSVREGYLGYYLPDEDHGPNYSVFVPFFATQKATLSGLGKLAKLSRAKIVPLMPVYNRQTGDFEVIVQPPLAPFPTGSEEADARMMNARIEQFLENDPGQYMWIMNLLRSKPDGGQRY